MSNVASPNAARDSDAKLQQLLKGDRKKCAALLTTTLALGESDNESQKHSPANKLEMKRMDPKLRRELSSMGRSLSWWLCR